MDRGPPPKAWSGPPRSAIVKAMKESVKTGHLTGLPDSLLRLFTPRPQLRLIKEKPKKKPALPYTGVAQYVDNFAQPGDPEYEPPPAADRPPSPRVFANREFGVQARIEAETKAEKKTRLQKWKKEEAEKLAEERLAAYDPNKDPNVEGDPYKTLFVARLSHEVTERKLTREFEEFGPIQHIRVVQDKISGKPRGYAFIEYESKKDMKEAYKLCDGRKLEGRRILVDVERGRTVENWRPMRLGGGLGGDGRLPKEAKKKGQPAVPALGAPLGAGPPIPRREPMRDDRDRGPPPPALRDTRDRDFERPRDRSAGFEPRGPPRDDRFDRGPPRDLREREGGDKRRRDYSPPRRDDHKRRHTGEDGELRDYARRDSREHDRDRRRDRDY